MRNTNIKSKLKTLLPFSVLPLILLMAYGLIFFAPPLTNLSYRMHFSGIHDLRHIDFDEITYVSEGFAEIILNELVAPEAFGSYDESRVHFDGVDHNTYLTSRLIFQVEDGKWYTFTRRSLGHTHRVYVNGNLLVDIGQPGVSPETDIPGSGRITFTAQGVDGVIEIVQQSTNHFHRYGGSYRHADWYIGTGTALTDAVRAEEFQTNILLGLFLMLAFLFILLFITHGQNRAALYFALFCLVWFIRVGVTGNSVFSVLLPQLDWFAALRLQYLSIPATAALTLVIINSLFPKVFHKPILYVLYGVSAVFATLFLFMNTLSMSYLMDWVYRIYGLAIAYLTICLIIKQFIVRRKINPPQIIFIFGLVIFLLSVLADFGYLPEVFLMPKYQFTGVAMLVFALCEASAIFIAAMREREEAIEARHRLSAEVAVLENLSQVKTEYYNTLQSHITEAKQARHDLRYHLSVFLSFITSGETRKLEEYINKYKDSLPDDTEVVFCENYSVNSILRYYIAIMAKEGIKVETQLITVSTVS